MHLRTFVAAGLGLFFLAPSPAIVAAQTAAGTAPLHFAQSRPAADDESRRKSRRPEPEEEDGQSAEDSAGQKSKKPAGKSGKQTGQKNEKKEKKSTREVVKDAPAKDAAKSAPAKGATKNAPAKDAAKAAPAKDAKDKGSAAERGKERNGEKQSASDRDDGNDRRKDRRGPSTAGSSRDDDSGTSADRNRGDGDDRRGRSSDDDDDRRDSRTTRSRGDDNDDRRGPSFSREGKDDDRRGPDVSRDRNDRDDRRGPSFSRGRDDDGDRRRRLERARERERERTPAEQLSRSDIRGDRPVEIDGGRRTLRRDGDRIVIRTDDSDRFRHWRNGRGDHRVERLPNGHTRTIMVYPDGSQIVTVKGPRGEILHRSRRDPRGREIVLIREVRRPPLAQIDLGPLRLSIPREQYIVDGRHASPQDLRAALVAPPVEPVERAYSLEEVRQFDRIRDKMRRIDITSITFDTDSALIAPDQAAALEELAMVIGDLIERNPAEVFMIEGHTDLVGSPVYNLALSDRRAEAVAIALTDYFAVPPENLVTQGYGEAFPKIPTEASERENRRVAVRRITPLVAGN